MTARGSESDGVRRVDRLLGQILAACGLVVTLAAGNRVQAMPAQFAPWWTALAVGAVGILVLLAGAGRVLPWPLLRGCWAAAVAVTLLAQLTVFAGYSGAHPDTLRPWVWALKPIMMCLVALLGPLPATVGYVALSTCAPLLSGLLFLTTVPHEVLLQTPIHLGNAAFIAILYGIRSRLIERERVVETARHSSERRQRAHAIAQEQQMLARIVHDEVLSTLVAATRLHGVPVPELRHAADDALRSLAHAAEPAVSQDAPAGAASAVPGRNRSGSRMEPPDMFPADDAARWLTSAAQRWIPSSAVRIRTIDADADGGVPRIIIEESALAMAEALRNSIAHATTAGTRRVDGEVGASRLQLLIDDDGGGFDVAAVPQERMGVRGSIVARMCALPGGSAQVRSDESGTLVLLEWCR